MGRRMGRSENNGEQGTVNGDRRRATEVDGLIKGGSFGT
jgi:hypothetical protein